MSILILVILLFSFLLGAIVGSFLNATVLRVRGKESFVKGRSYCPHCKHSLSLFDLIPIFSFLVLKGRCRYCKENISIQYLLMEIITGIIFLLYFNFVGISFIFLPNFINIINILYDIVLISAFIYIALFDFLYFEISGKLVYVLSFIVFLYFLIFTILGYYSIDILLNHILFAFVIAAFFLIIILITRGNGMGGGDMKLAFLMGLILGYPQILFVIFLSFILGSIVGVILLVFKVKKLKSHIPFAPFLSLSMIIYIIFSFYILQVLHYLFIV
ncbi:prepilin peptidase [Patescibacteria group bacterium]|nr:prepilin peptidase [Patescibacteria group bacterium]